MAEKNSKLPTTHGEEDNDEATYIPPKQDNDC